MNNRKTKTLIDNGNKVDIIDPTLARTLQLATFKLNKPIPLYLADRTHYHDLTEAALLDLQIEDHSK
jgi:hypothetical protein